MEVHVRERCPYFKCNHGRVYGDSNKYPWETCSTCKGSGYVESWVDFKELVKRTLSLGD